MRKSSKPILLASLFGMASAALEMFWPGSLFSQVHWLAMGLPLFALTMWPTRQPGYLVISTGLWVAWFLLSGMFALIQIELFQQAIRFSEIGFWPLTYTQEPRVLVSWMTAMLPALIGLNLDFRNGAKAFPRFKQGALLGGAIAPVLTGLVEPTFAYPFIGAVLPIWFLGVFAAQRERVKAAQGFKLLAGLFPLAVLIHALPAPAWIETAFLAMLSVRILSPAPKRWKWAASLGAGLAWGLLVWAGGALPLVWRILAMGASLILVGGPWYTWNWISGLLLLLSNIVLVLLVVLSTLELQPWIQMSVGMPMVLALLLFADRGAQASDPLVTEI